MKIEVVVLYFSFLVVHLNVNAQELEPNGVFREVYSCHFKFEGDVLLFRKDEIISLQYTQSRDSLFEKKLFIVKKKYDREQRVYLETYSQALIDTLRYHAIIDSLKENGYSEPGLNEKISTHAGVTTYELRGTRAPIRISINREIPIDGKYIITIKRKKKKIQSFSIKDENPCFYFVEFYRYFPGEIMMVLSASYCADDIYKVCYIFEE
jgi:hypothetical protein